MRKRKVENLSFLFSIYDNTNTQDGGYVLCPIPGYNEQTSPAFQYIETGMPQMQSDYGSSSNCFWRYEAV